MVVRSRRVHVGCVVAALCLGGGLALGGATAGAARPHPIGYSYKVEAAHLDVSEIGKFRADHGPVKWDADGHYHQKMAPPDPEFPPLPAGLLLRGTSSVFVRTDVTVDGAEKLIDAEGHRAPCSGVFSAEKKSGIGVNVKPKGDGTMTTWEIPHGFISPRCGQVFDYLPDPLLDKKKVKGDIGDDHLVLEIRGKASKTKILRDGTVDQDLKWEGRIVLQRGKPF